MYSLETKLTAVRGIGPQLFQKLSAIGIITVRDLLLQLPLRYEDRSHFVKIAELPADELVTVQAKVLDTSQFYRNGKNIQTATVADETGRLKLMWFNNRFILSNLKKGQEYLFSGKYNSRFRNMTQPAFEALKADTLHTGRLVPLYSSTLPLQQGTLRRVLKHILDELYSIEDPVPEIISAQQLNANLPDFKSAVSALHFPDSIEQVAGARERLALEEFLAIMRASARIKEEWRRLQSAPAIPAVGEDNRKLDLEQELPIPANLPFILTGAQEKAVREILDDMAKKTPMNRLLVGDVGSGKTVVAGIAAAQTIKAGWNVALIAPTRILAEQHTETFAKLFPDLEVVLFTGQTKKPAAAKTTPVVYVGTHAVINKLPEVKPGLIIYDEQHRFGVRQRSEATGLEDMPHLLTMSATPIPRSLMLTIFSHLQMSYIDEMPAGRLPVTTWLVPEKKRHGAYDWLAEELQKTSGQVFLVCPFIDPSEDEAFAQVAAASSRYQELSDYFANRRRSKQNQQLQIALLHGRMKKNEQAEVIDRLYSGRVDILVTTPVVEVGVDLPKANIIVIESAERFGLASLHQLRGRVGRAGQESYCLLFTNAKSGPARERLKAFTAIHDGRKLAELDLQNRGSGEIFGTVQSGFSNLQFASWTNLELIGIAQKIFDQLSPDWKPLFAAKEVPPDDVPLAN